MKASWMVLPLVLGLSSLNVACDAGGDAEGGEQLEDEQLETEPNGAEPREDEEESEEDGDD